MWKAGIMVKVGRATTVVPHRVHSVRLRELGTDTEFHVIGVYAGCRDARAHVRRTARDDGEEEQRESVRLWRALGACTRVVAKRKSSCCPQCNNNATKRRRPASPLRQKCSPLRGTGCSICAGSTRELGQSWRVLFHSRAAGSAQ